MIGAFSFRSKCIITLFFRTTYIYVVCTVFTICTLYWNTNLIDFKRNCNYEMKLIGASFFDQFHRVLLSSQFILIIRIEI